ncbi:hypothetical protein Pan216_30320 [Planctomycetes bacterium Pan216]|uniref:Uncharacterized protein n=1 Tax=Kolteria novifilia TaxID=2527975 RepID=A0A518B5C6_9BACT|nr:hypothetical protein Pan216_30320 [Planctomycetes bacterium Pan216]
MTIANPNIKPSNQTALVGVITPQTVTAPDDVTTAWLDMGQFFGALATVFVSVLPASATLDAVIEQAKDDQGTDAEEITTLAITQLTEDSLTGQAMINVRPEDLSFNDGFTHARLKISVAGDDTVVAGLLQAFYPRYGFADHLTSVVEVVGG